MPGYGFLNKKEFHTGSFKNIGKVWQAEQRKLAAESAYTLHKKRLMEEQYEEELKKYQVNAGLIPESSLNKMDWMYNHESVEKAKNIGEEYLLGKPVEGSALQAPKPQIAKESDINDKNENFRRLHEDPLFKIKREELKYANGLRGSGLSSQEGVTKKIHKVKDQPIVKKRKYSDSSDSDDDSRRLAFKHGQALGHRQGASNEKTKELFEYYVKNKLGQNAKVNPITFAVKFGSRREDNRTDDKDTKQDRQIESYKRNAKEVESDRHITKNFLSESSLSEKNNRKVPFMKEYMRDALEKEAKRFK